MHDHKAEPAKVNFPNPIDEYIAKRPANIQILLLDVLQEIRGVLPDATEKISWQMPTFWQGRNIVNLDLTDVREMVALLRRSSNNLNQIAKRVNETRSIYEADIQDLQDHYDKLWDQVNRILKGLAKL